MTHSELKAKVSLLPFNPGIYMMKDKNGKIIYVGKSKCLHNRVSHYFQPLSALDPKTAKLSVNISDFECIYTSSEAEALILENELIKRHKPKYNIKLKDAKTYPYIKFMKDKPYPEIVMSRTRNDDKSLYFGPYVSSKNAKDIIDIVSKTFGIATCGKRFEYGKRLCRPCLFFHLGQCLGPCSGKISSVEYRDVLYGAEQFLRGNYNDVISEMEEKMMLCAEKTDFENAAKLRDRIAALKKLNEHQNIITDPDKEFDVFGLYSGENSSALCVIFIRNGKVIDKEDYIFNSDEMTDDIELSNFIERFYQNCGYIPSNILLSFKLSDNELEALSNNLSGEAGKKVTLSTPERGLKKTYTDLSVRNAHEFSRQKHEMVQKDEEILVKIASVIGLEVVPSRIEAYDISNNGKDDIYAGMIVLEDGKFKKSDYRSFSIKELEDKEDDYASMREALRRRLKYLVNCKDNVDSSFNVLPDLILLDGGVGHINSVKSVMLEYGVDIPLIGMVKDEFHKTRTLTNGEKEISISKEFDIFTFIYKIQEEVHRFTFSKMDASRNKKVKHSVLENIPGIGSAKAGLLLRKFKSIRNIRESSVEQLASVQGVTEDLAKRILEYLNDK